MCARRRKPGIAETVLRECIAQFERLHDGRQVHFDDGDDGHSALTHSAVFLVLRRRATLDWLIDRRADRRVRGRLRRVLWWALAEILWMRGLPAAVVVDTCVSYVQRRYSRREAGFINAWLRSFLASGPREVLAADLESAPPWVRLDVGRELWSAWNGRFSETELTELAALLQTPAPLTVRLRPEAPVTVPSWLAPLAAPSWAPWARVYTCLDAESLFGSAWLSRGYCYVQDPSTLLAPALLAASPGAVVADLCCAPGGKSLVLAEQVHPHGCVLCFDRSAQRLRRVIENLSSVPECEPGIADAAAPPVRNRALDGVLLDVPCSNSGVVRRRPDVRWRFSGAAVRELAGVQRRLLLAAADAVRPGGRIVYSTCSIEPEENGEVVHAFLAARPDYSLSAERLLLPGEHHDGAYAAALNRSDRVVGTAGSDMQ